MSATRPKKKCNHCYYRCRLFPREHPLYLDGFCTPQKLAQCHQRRKCDAPSTLLWGPACLQSCNVAMQARGSLGVCASTSCLRKGNHRASGDPAQRQVGSAQLLSPGTAECSKPAVNTAPHKAPPAKMHVSKQSSAASFPPFLPSYGAQVCLHVDSNRPDAPSIIPPIRQHKGERLDSAPSVTQHSSCTRERQIWLSPSAGLNCGLLSTFSRAFDR